MVKKSIMLVCCSLAFGGAIRAEQETLVINITSKVSVDKNSDDLFSAIKEYSKKLTHELGTVRGVTEVETTVDSDCGSVCKREIIRCSECGGTKEEVTTTQAETKCSGCGQTLKACSSCGKCSSSCTSCCK